jgi:TPR repeat protein/serine/threonine protein kinase
LVSPLDTLLAKPPADRWLGPYALDEQLGRGGFAPVWKAREVYGETEMRTVALKIFPIDAPGAGQTAPPSSGPRSERLRHRERVIQEARSLCQVEHPHVVRFHALHVDEAAGLIALVMEHLAGRSLERRLREEGPLPPAEVLSLGLALASALVAVHAAGLIHRDLKPANVIEARGGYKLIDFGIASAGEIERKSAPKRVVLDDLPFDVAGSRMSVLAGAVAITTAGPQDAGQWLASGTVGYMDPESVASGVPATVASDLYSLGALLFECLTGKLPSAAAATAGQGLRGEVLDGRAAPPALLSLVPAAHPALGALVDALLSPHRAQRPSSAREVEASLQKILDEVDPPRTARLSAGEPVSVAAAPPARAFSWRHAGLAAALGVLGLGLIGSVVLLVERRAATRVCAMGNAADCTQRCKEGSADSCYNLALMYERASGVPRDENLAAELYERACTAGVPRACYALGSLREAGRGGPRDEVRARELYKQACDGNDAQGCNGLAIIVSSGPVEQRQDTQAVLLFQRACDGGYANGCANLGIHFEHGRGVERNATRARQLYEGACHDGSPSACGMLGFSLLTDHGGPPDPARAAGLFERACSGGHSFACVGGGTLYENGNGLPRDTARAAALYRKACDDRVPEGCQNLGQLHQRGDGVHLDPTRAFGLFRQACDLGYAVGCRTAGEAFAAGLGVPPSDAQAVELFTRGCEPSPGVSPDQDSCAWLAACLRDGKGVARDPDRARALLERACQQGATLGCVGGRPNPAPAPSTASSAPRRPPLTAAPHIPNIRCSPGDPLCGM